MATYALTLFLLTALQFSCWTFEQNELKHHLQLPYNGQLYNLLNVTNIKNEWSICGDVQTIETGISNRDHFITPQMRYSLCDLAYRAEGREVDGSLFDMQCYTDGASYKTIMNPCYLVCHNRRLAQHASDDCEASMTPNLYLLTDIKCGERHVCNINGCCVEEEAISPNTEPNPDTPEPEGNHTIPDISPDHKTPDPVTPKPPPLTPKPIPTDRHVCKQPGYSIFLPNRQYYFFCKLYATIHSCGSDRLFNANLGVCQFDPKTADPELPFWQWRDAISCPTFGVYLRSPYNCRYYYTCTKDERDGEVQVFFNHCHSGLVFNETSQRCDYKTSRCFNRLVVP